MWQMLVAHPTVIPPSFLLTESQVCSGVTPITHILGMRVSSQPGRAVMGHSESQTSRFLRPVIGPGRHVSLLQIPRQDRWSLGEQEFSFCV